MGLEHDEAGQSQSMVKLEGVYKRGGVGVDDGAGGTAHDHADDSGFQQAAIAISHQKAQQVERQAPEPEHAPRMPEQKAHQEREQRIGPGQRAVQIEYRDPALRLGLWRGGFRGDHGYIEIVIYGAIYSS